MIIFTFTQGRYDIVCPIMSAWDLHKAWPEAQLKVYTVTTIFLPYFIFIFTNNLCQKNYKNVSLDRRLWSKYYIVDITFRRVVILF